MPLAAQILLIMTDGQFTDIYDCIGSIVEASDYLTNKHDWVQLEEEITPPLRRALYEPQRPAQRAVSLVCACVMRDI